MYKVLFLVQLPDPVHGASLVNLGIKNSDYINSNVDSSYVDISSAGSMSTIGKFSIAKIFLTFQILMNCLKEYFVFKPSRVYITLSPHGFAFWKDALILMALKVFGANIVVHLHGKGINQEVSSSAFKLFIYRLVFNRVDIIHLSEALFYDVEKVFDQRMSLSAVNNGVADYGLAIAKEGSVPVFLYLSNLAESKGIGVFIAAVNLLDEKYVGKFIVKVVGREQDPAFLLFLKNSVSEKFKPYVKFMGPLYGDKKNQILASSDVFVLPTKYKNESFPLSILESMSFGLPVLSTFEGAIPDIVDDGVNGFLFSPDNVVYLASKIANYIDDPDLLASHGKASRSKYEDKYTIDLFEQSLLTALINHD
jgi:glycosyltransferase involved in cell wall biosynthesis